PACPVASGTNTPSTPPASSPATPPSSSLASTKASKPPTPRAPNPNSPLWPKPSTAPPRSWKPPQNDANAKEPRESFPQIAPRALQNHKNRHFDRRRRILPPQWRNL